MPSTSGVVPAATVTADGLLGLTSFGSERHVVGVVALVLRNRAGQNRAVGDRGLERVDERELVGIRKIRRGREQQLGGTDRRARGVEALGPDLVLAAVLGGDGRIPD